MRIYRTEPPPILALRMMRYRQSVLHRDPYGVLGRRYAPQFVTDYIASLGIYGDYAYTITCCRTQVDIYTVGESRCMHCKTTFTIR